MSQPYKAVLKVCYGYTVARKRKRKKKYERKSNIIINGLPEPTATQSEDRKSEDSDLTQELFHALTCDEITVNHMTKLGPPKTESDQNPKPRPVKIWHLKRLVTCS